MLKKTLMTLVVACTFSYAADKKNLAEVKFVDFMKETQITGFSEMQETHVVWWIPVEYFELSLAQFKTMDSSETIKYITALQPYFVLAVSQADIGAFGNFEFYPQDVVLEGMEVSYEDSTGGVTIVSPYRDQEGSVSLYVDLMKPVFKAAMGNFGASLHFFIFPDVKGDSTRLVSPYTTGKLKVQLTTIGGRTLTAEIETPVNSLFVPRKCRNGKDAHVSWKYCPWTGAKLEK